MVNRKRIRIRDQATLDLILLLHQVAVFDAIQRFFNYTLWRFRGRGATILWLDASDVARYHVAVSGAGCNYSLARRL